MRKDPRLDHQGPEEEQYKARRKHQQEQLRTRYADVDWEKRITPLAVVVEKLVAGEKAEKPLAPTEFDRDLSEAWATLAQALLEGESSSLPDHVGGLLADKLSAALAAREQAGPQRWFQVARILERTGAALAYLDHLPLDLLQAHEQELLALSPPRSPLEWVDTFDRLREPKQQHAYLKELPAREQAARDRWDWLEQVQRDADTCTFREPLWMQAHLLGRLGGHPWLRFVRTLPLSLLRDIAVRDVESPDEALELLGLALDEAVAGEAAHEELLILLTMRTLELWRRIHGNLAHCASGRSFLVSEYPEFLARAKAAAQDWEAQELPERARALAVRLCSGQEVGIYLACLTMQHLFSRPTSWTGSEKDLIPVVRGAFVEVLVSSGQPLADLVQRLLETGSQGKAALLAASEVVLSDKENFSEDERSRQDARIWEAYAQQLQKDSFFFNASLREDERRLAEVLGGVLARLPAPMEALLKAMDAVRRPAEGWKADYRQFLESIQQLAHLFIVGALASHWRKLRGQDTQPLFRFVWKSLHAWLRTLPEVNGAEQVRSAIIQVWSRLWLIEGPAATQYALAELPRLDQIEWLLDAARHLQMNQEPAGGPAQLDPRVQQVLWSRFELLFPVFRLRHSVNPEEANVYEKRALQLTPALRANDS